MKRLIMLVVTVGCLAALGGCVVVPAHGYYYHPRAMVVAPLVAVAPIVAVRPW
jgi:hypothetical protein